MDSKVLHGSPTVHQLAAGPKVLHGPPVVTHTVLSSSCSRCAAELRPPAKRNTVYLQSTVGGPWLPHCPPCAKLVVTLKGT